MQEASQGPTVFAENTETKPDNACAVYGLADHSTMDSKFKDQKTTKLSSTSERCTICKSGRKANHPTSQCRFRNQKCANCGTVGHLAEFCTAEHREPVTDQACAVCGKSNHSTADCRVKDQKCSICGKKGHLAKFCYSKKMPACAVCGTFNHFAAQCKFKGQSCKICGKLGHLAKVCRNRPSTPALEPKEGAALRPKLSVPVLAKKLKHKKNK